MSIIFSGSTLAGWATLDDGSWCFYNEDGTIATNSWKKSGDYWYYMGNDGKTSYDTIIVDTDGEKYYVDATGRMVANTWVIWEGNYFYAGSNGYLVQETEVMMYTGAAAALNEMVEASLNPYTLVIKNVYYNRVSNHDRIYARWNIEATGINGFGGYSKIYSNANIKFDGSYSSYASSNDGMNSEFYINATKIDIEKTIAIYREIYNDYRTTISY